MNPISQWLRVWWLLWWVQRYGRFVRSLGDPHPVVRLLLLPLEIVVRLGGWGGFALMSVGWGILDLWKCGFEALQDLIQPQGSRVGRYQIVQGVLGRWCARTRLCGLWITRYSSRDLGEAQRWVMINEQLDHCTYSLSYQETKQLAQNSWEDLQRFGRRRLLKLCCSVDEYFRLERMCARGNG